MVTLVDIIQTGKKYVQRNLLISLNTFGVGKWSPKFELFRGILYFVQKIDAWRSHYTSFFHR